jgi:hypothetical protein
MASRIFNDISGFTLYNYVYRGGVIMLVVWCRKCSSRDGYSCISPHATYYSRSCGLNHHVLWQR